MAYTFDEPVGWKVTAAKDKTGIDGLSNDAYYRTFKTKDEAVAYKADLQQRGHVACVTPVYISKPTLRKKLKRQQRLIADGIL